MGYIIINAIHNVQKGGFYHQQVCVNSVPLRVKHVLEPKIHAQAAKKILICSIISAWIHVPLSKMESITEKIATLGNVLNAQI